MRSAGGARRFVDERTAEEYEAKWPELFEPVAIDPVVTFLAAVAGTGAALGLSIGTGRIALPLSQGRARPWDRRVSGYGC